MIREQSSVIVSTEFLTQHCRYLRERKTTADESEVISEVLDHTPSETVPEEVLEEATPTKSQATPTSSQRTTDYSNDSFEPTSQGHTPSRSDHTPSHPPPIAQESESEPTSGGYLMCSETLYLNVFFHLQSPPVVWGVWSRGSLS